MICRYLLTHPVDVNGPASASILRLGIFGGDESSTSTT